MPAYVLMTKLGTPSLQDPRGRRIAGHEWKRKVASLCPGVRWLAHYALLGPYDFMDIYEATGDEEAFRVSMLSRELGAVIAESWPAVSYDRYLPIADGVDARAKGNGKRNGRAAKGARRPQASVRRGLSPRGP